MTHRRTLRYVCSELDVTCVVPSVVNVCHVMSCHVTELLLLLIRLMAKMTTIVTVNKMAKRQLRMCCSERCRPEDRHYQPSGRRV